MAIRSILTYPNPILRERAKEISSITQEVTELVQDMLKTMEAARGVGLAANQVGVPLRIFVFNPLVQENAPLQEAIGIVNPRILERSGSILWEEGCLSFPGMEATVKRAERVVLDGLDKAGRPLGAIELQGLLAVCVQHEIDHLDGTLFIDHLSRLKREILLKHYFAQDSRDSLSAKAHS
jgi:peptide deformylase